MLEEECLECGHVAEEPLHFINNYPICRNCEHWHELSKEDEMYDAARQEKCDE